MNLAIPIDTNVGTELLSLGCIQFMINGPIVLVVQDWAMDWSNDNELVILYLK
jgi:hypothetical protein